MGRIPSVLDRVEPSPGRPALTFRRSGDHHLLVEVGEAVLDIDLRVRVQTPEWIEPGTLRVYQDGAVVHEVALDTRAADGVWFDGALPIASDRDAWFVVEVEGDVTQGAAWRDAAPRALTNAFFLDVGGDGWSAPGLP